MPLKAKEGAFESFIYIRIASCSQFFPYLIHPIILSLLIRPNSYGLGQNKRRHFIVE